MILDRVMPRAIGGMGLAAVLVALFAVSGQGMQAVDCSARYPVGAFALPQSDAARVVGAARGFSLVHMRKKPLLMTAFGSENPCELVYAGDVFELTGAETPDALVAGCAGEFRGQGVRDYVVLLRRLVDGHYVPHVFLARGGAFDVTTLEAHAAEDPAWFGPACAARPRNGLFQAPDFEGTGKPAQVTVVGDLITIGWWTYYWRRDLGRFERILTSD